MYEIAVSVVACVYKHKYGVSTSKLELSPTPATKTKKKGKCIEHTTREYHSFLCMLYLFFVVGVVDDNFCSMLCSCRSDYRCDECNLFSLCIRSLRRFCCWYSFRSFLRSFYSESCSFCFSFDFTALRICMRLHDYNVYLKLLSNTQRCLKNAFTMHAQCYHKLFPLLSCEQEHN